MAVHPKEGKMLWHITALENIEGIIENGLCPRNSLEDFRDIADGDILNKREKFNLEDYTPFHFFAGTPFSGSVQIGNPGIEFVYLCIRRSFASEAGFRVVPTHPLHYDGEPLDWGSGINAIDWDLMGRREYDDYECKEVCMAEAICHGPVSFDNIWAVYVKTDESAEVIKGLLEKHKNRNLSVRINKNQAMFV